LPLPTSSIRTAPPKSSTGPPTAPALRSQGLTWRTVAHRLAVAESTAVYYAHQEQSARISARRAIIACLVGCGPRSSELCEIDIRHVDFAHRHISVVDAKTDAGIRRVDLSPMLLDDLLAWRASLRDPEADTPFFATRTGKRTTRDNVNARVIRPAVRRANERRACRELPAARARHRAHAAETYISMVFAEGAEVPYVMAPGRRRGLNGPLEIYARVLKRRDRDDIGRAFDDLLLGRVGRTHAAHAGPGTQTSEPSRRGVRAQYRARRGWFSRRSGQRPGQSRLPRVSGVPVGFHRTRRIPMDAGTLRMELGGLEPPTSWVRSRRSPN
jgi:Phage integrase family